MQGHLQVSVIYEEQIFRLLGISTTYIASSRWKQRLSRADPHMNGGKESCTRKKSGPKASRSACGLFLYSPGIEELVWLHFWLWLPNSSVA
jgi:hypothetical protein